VYSATDPTHHQYGAASATPIITADETWLADHVYFILSTFGVRGSTLTIEAGARVCLDSGGASAPTINVDESGTTEGKVYINGTAARPVIFDQATVDSRYSGFSFVGLSDARFDHVVFKNGGYGGNGVLRFGANLPRAVVLRNVHLENFFHVGVTLQNPAGLSSDSSLFLDSQESTSTEPVVASTISALRTLTPGTAVIAPSIAAGSRAIRFMDQDVDADLTLSASLGADYLVQSGNLTVRRAVASAAIPTLTLEAGTTVRFGDGELMVGDVGTDNAGSLVVNGTPSAPVVLTGAALPPAAGQWLGVGLYLGGLGTSTLSNLRIENAGAAGGTNILNCRSAALGTPIAGALRLKPVQTMDYAAPTIENLSIVRSDGEGVAFHCVAAGCLTTDVTAAVTCTDVAGTCVRALGCQ
jgi:hypothetical protein